MANEATLIFETELPIPMTCANATGIEKGTPLKLTDPMTAIINSGAGDECAGIAAAEKIASDGQTKIPVYRRGIFKGLAGGAINVGDPITIHSVVNEFVAAGVNEENIWGVALETAADTDTFLFELNPTSVNLA